MKRLLLSLAIGLGTVASTSAMAATPAFSAQKAAQVKLPDLSFKHVMRAFYNGQITTTHINDEQVIDYLPYIGLGYQNKNGQQTVAVMHPAVTYKNLKGENRYLVIIEKVLTDSNTYEVQRCHACNATADVYSFKRLNDGRYQLVSRSHPESIFPNNYGRIQFNVSDFKKGLQPLGSNLIGSLFTIDDYFSGATFNYWEALHLPEDDYINSVSVGDAGSDYGGMYEKDSPLYYEYEVTYTVMPNNSKYYPIMLSFKGDMPVDNDYNRIEYVNHSVIKKFNPAKKEYQ